MRNDLYSFKLLYDIMIHNRAKKIEQEKINHFLKLADLNKVKLGFLEKISLYNEEYHKELKKYKNIVSVAITLSELLYGLDFVFFKFLKPVLYVPSDIDILITRKHVEKAAKILRRNGFKIVVIEPYCITFKNKDIVIDLYVHPTIGNIIYLDGEELLSHKTWIKLMDYNIPVLEKNMEALVVIAHAVYKERIYTLNDYITTKKWLKDVNKIYAISKSLHVSKALKLVLKINELVDNNEVILPLRISLCHWLWILGSKVIEDSLARSTLLFALGILKDKQFGSLLINRLTRKTY